MAIPAEKIKQLKSLAMEQMTAYVTVKGTVEREFTSDLAKLFTFNSFLMLVKMGRELDDAAAASPDKDD